MLMTAWAPTGCFPETAVAVAGTRKRQWSLGRRFSKGISRLRCSIRLQEAVSVLLRRRAAASSIRGGASAIPFSNAKRGSGKSKRNRDVRPAGRYILLLCIVWCTGRLEYAVYHPQEQDVAMCVACAGPEGRPALFFRAICSPRCCETVRIATDVRAAPSLRGEPPVPVAPPGCHSCEGLPGRDQRRPSGDDCCQAGWDSRHASGGTAA